MKNFRVTTGIALAIFAASAVAHDESQCGVDVPDIIPEVITEVNDCVAGYTGSLGSARAEFNIHCSAYKSTRDCDPIEKGSKIYRCSSQRIGNAGGGRTTNVVTNTPTVVAQVSTVTPQTHWADSYSANGKCYIDSTFDHDIGNTMVQTPVGLRSVRQVAFAIGDGPGKAGNPIYNDVQCGNGPANNNGDEDPDQCPGRVDLGSSGCFIKGPLWDLNSAFPTSNPTASTSDGIFLFYDGGPDHDDKQAIVSGKHVVDKLNLDPVVVIGTTGHAIRDKFLPAMRGLADSLYPNHFDASTTSGHNAAVVAVANEMQSILQAGKRVRIAEGGPSDFTFDVVDRLKGKGLNLKNIELVQHSTIFNEGQTRAASIASLKRDVTYKVIGNGNSGNSVGGVNVADFQQTKDGAQCLSLRNAISGTNYHSQWLTAMTIITPARFCDFSDTVELLYIVGDTGTQTIANFVSKYMK